MAKSDPNLLDCLDGALLVALRLVQELERAERRLAEARVQIAAYEALLGGAFPDPPNKS